MFSLLTPSMIYNLDKGLTSVLSLGKVMFWYLGYKDENLTHEMYDAIDSNHHTLLLDEEERKEYHARVDYTRVPNIYTNKSYYADKSILKAMSSVPSKLDESSILFRDQQLADQVKRFFSDEFSPGMHLLYSH